MAKGLKLYDVHFTLAENATILVSAYSKKDAKEEADRLLEDKAELIDRLLDAVNFGGLKIKCVEEVDDEIEEE